MQIPDKLKRFVNGPHGMNMGTRDANLKPEYHRVLGTRFVDDQHINVFFDRISSGRTISNINDNHTVSVVLCSMVNFESYQFKGKSKGIRESNAEELQLVQDYFRDTNVLLVNIGFADRAIYKYPHSSMVTLLLEVEEIFEQTPKIGTGQQVIV